MPTKAFPCTCPMQWMPSTLLSNFPFLSMGCCTAEQLHGSSCFLSILLLFITSRKNARCSETVNQDPFVSSSWGQVTGEWNMNMESAFWYVGSKKWTFLNRAAKLSWECRFMKSDSSPLSTGTMCLSFPDLPHDCFAESELLQNTFFPSKLMKGYLAAAVAVLHTVSNKPTVKEENI